MEGRKIGNISVFANLLHNSLELSTEMKNSIV